MTNRSENPVTSFGSVLFTLLLKGSHERIERKFPFRIAAHTRMRIHKLRKRMRDENHPEYLAATRARVTIEWDENTIPTHHGPHGAKKPIDPEALVTLVVQPQDADIEEAYRDILEIKPLNLDKIAQDTSSSSGSLDDWLAGVGKKHTEEK